MALKSVANRAQKRGKVYHDFVKYSPLEGGKKREEGGEMGGKGEGEKKRGE